MDPVDHFLHFGSSSQFWPSCLLLLLLPFQHSASSPPKLANTMVKSSAKSWNQRKQFCRPILLAWEHFVNMCCFNGYCTVEPWYCKNDFASTNQEFAQQEMAIQAGKTMEFDQHKFVMPWSLGLRCNEWWSSLLQDTQSIYMVIPVNPIHDHNGCSMGIYTDLLGNSWVWMVIFHGRLAL